MEMNNYGLTYKLTMCSLKIYASKVVAISKFVNFKKIAFSLGSISFFKKTNSC
jgi:hypothetical protein